MQPNFNKILSTLRILVAFTFFIAPVAHAATTPSLGVAGTFGILSHTYINNFNFTSITGDLGYVVAPSIAPTVSGSTHVSDTTFNQAISDQATALSSLNSQPCTFTFAPGNIDLATDTTHGPAGIYTPGVYCANGNMTHGGSTTLVFNGAGTYIFRPTGTLTTANFSQVDGTNGVTACDIFWTPGGSTILGSNSVFAGTVIEPVGPISLDITVGAHTNWGGRALDAYANTISTVTTGVDVNIALITCSPPPPAQGTLHVVKIFNNNFGGTAISSDAIVHVKNGAGDVAGSPHAGAGSPGTSYTLNADTYIVSENTFAGYTATISGDCDANGHVTLAGDDNKICTISNDQNPPPPSLPATLHVIKHVINNNSAKETASAFTLHVLGAGSFGMSDVAGSPAAGTEAPGTTYSLTAGTYVVNEDTHTGYTQSFSGDCDSKGNITLIAGDNKTCTIINDDIPDNFVPPPPVILGTATLHVIKIVVNDNGGKAVESDATIHVMSSLGDVTGSPHAGASSPGIAYTLSAGTYTVSEDFFPGYTVLVAGDCTANGTVDLAVGDNKTCTITNNDIKGVVPPPPTIIIFTPPTIVPPITPPTSKPPCDICGKLSYDVYIVNPNKTERHTGTPWVRVTDRGNGVLRYSFEDKTLNPQDINYDYNDAVVDVDYKDCTKVKFMFVSSDADWKHKIKIKVMINSVLQSDTLVANDSKAVVGTIKTIDATTKIKPSLSCPTPKMIQAACKADVNKNNKLELKKIVQDRTDSLRQALIDFRTGKKYTDAKNQIAQTYKDATKTAQEKLKSQIVACK